MTIQTINVGAAANDGTGDPHRTAFQKINDSFTEVQALIAASESDASKGGTDDTVWNVWEVAGSTTLSDSNKRVTGAGGSSQRSASKASSSRRKGKWYLEYRIEANGSAIHVGLCSAGFTALTTAENASGIAGLYINPFAASGGMGLNNSTTVTLTGWTGGGAGAIISFAVDFDAGTTTVRENNAQPITLPWAGPSCGWSPWVQGSTTGGGTGYSATLRTTTAACSYTPPTGFTVWDNA